MKIFAIADLHMDNKKEKPMDIFGENWKNHEERIFKSWEEKVNDDDLILMPGDISWAINLKEAIEDLKKIDRLSGTKIMIRGNHDYWWRTKSKLDKLGLKSIVFLKNDSFEINNIGIYGTRGWISRDDKEFEENDEKIFRRELIRLENSLQSSNTSKKIKIALMHFPPFYYSGETNEFVKKMKDYKIDICLYGHLHGEGHNNIKEGNIEGIQFYCVSSDYLDFNLKEIPL